MKEAIEKSLEIEKRKYNIAIYGVPENDEDKDIDSVAAILGDGLHLDFDRHVEKMARIARLVLSRWQISFNKNTDQDL
jgi:hypothetical protein